MLYHFSKFNSVEKVKEMFISIFDVIFNFAKQNYKLLNRRKVDIAFDIHKIPYSKLSVIILITLIILTIYFTGILGLLVFITGTALGISAILIGIRRMHLMGALLIPSILFYIF